MFNRNHDIFVVLTEIKKDVGNIDHQIKDISIDVDALNDAVYRSENSVMTRLKAVEDRVHSLENQNGAKNRWVASLGASIFIVLLPLVWTLITSVNDAHPNSAKPSHHKSYIGRKA